VGDGVALLALTLGERAIILASPEDPPDDLGELRAVLLADHTWRRAPKGSTETDAAPMSRVDLLGSGRLRIGNTPYRRCVSALIAAPSGWRIT